MTHWSHVWKRVERKGDDVKCTMIFCTYDCATLIYMKYNTKVVCYSKFTMIYLNDKSKVYYTG